jgi:hypothetical protein
MLLFINKLKLKYQIINIMKIILEIPDNDSNKVIIIILRLLLLDTNLKAIRILNSLKTLNKNFNFKIT